MPEQGCMCVCVLMVKVSFLSFQCEQVFFNSDNNDYSHHRSCRMLHIMIRRLTLNATMSQNKNNLQVVSKTSMYTHFCKNTIMSHPMNRFFPTFGDGMLQKGAMQGFSQFTHLTKGCTQIAETHRHGGIWTATFQVADG